MVYIVDFVPKQKNLKQKPVKEKPGKFTHFIFF
jgi:hypothetical protein